MVKSIAFIKLTSILFIVCAASVRSISTSRVGQQVTRQTTEWTTYIYRTETYVSSSSRNNVSNAVINTTDAIKEDNTTLINGNENRNTHETTTLQTSNLTTSSDTQESTANLKNGTMVQEPSSAATTSLSVTSTTYDYGAYTDSLYDGFSNSEQSLNDLLQSERTLKYIATFVDTEHQFIIQQQLRHCPYTPLCGFSLNITLDSGSEEGKPCCLTSCSCKPNCNVYRNCCPDIISFLHEGDNRTYSKLYTTTTKEYIQNQSKTATLNNANVELSFIRMHIKRNNPLLFRQTGALVYSHCMTSGSIYELNCTREYTTDIETFVDILPVSTKDSKVTYRNKYCAFCNNIEETELLFWSPKFNCLDKALKILSAEKYYIREVVTNNECDIMFYSNFARPRRCYPIISRCNETGDWREYNRSTERACSMYSSVIAHNHEYYKNVFCVLCNGYTPYKTVCSLSSNRGNEMFSFSGLLSVNRENPKDNKIEQCEDGLLWDIKRKQCMPYYCSDIRQPKNGNCSKVYDSLLKMVYVVYLRLVPTATIRVIEAHLMADAIVPWLNNTVLKFDSNTGGVREANILYKSDMPFENDIDPGTITEATLSYFDMRFKVYFPELHDPELILNSFIEMQSKEVHLSMNETVINIGSKTIKIGNKTHVFLPYIRDGQGHDNIYKDKISTSKSTFTDSKSRPNGALSMDKLTSYTLADDIDKLTIIPHYRMNDELIEWGMGLKHSALLTFTSCPRFEISKTDIFWIVDVTGIKFPISDMTLRSSDYNFVDQCNPFHIRICTNMYDRLVNDMTQSKPMPTETVLSFICVSVSMICLFVTVLTFGLFSELRTVPGKNTMTLTIYLLIAQLFYLIGSQGGFKQGSIACKAVGIAIHLFWLLSLFWMNICSIHTFRIFVRSEVISKNRGWKLYVHYHAYASLIPGLLIATNVVVSLSTSSGVSIGYGDGNICYISSAKMQEYTFAIPAGVIVCSNLIMFLIVVIKIKRMPEVPSSTKHDRNYMKVFAKLSTLTGVTWIFGLVYSWSGWLVFSYLFIILCGGQGVFLMLSFVINPRVLKLYRVSFHSTLISKYTTSTAVTSQSTRIGRSRQSYN